MQNYFKRCRSSGTLLLAGLSLAWSTGVSPQKALGASKDPAAQVSVQNVNWKALRDQARQEVMRVCEMGNPSSGDGLSKDRERLATLVVTDVSHRKALVVHLRDTKGKGPCGELVQGKLAAFRGAFSRGEMLQSYQEFRPYVLLAVAAGLPSGSEILADLSRADPGHDWLIALRSYDPEAYSKTLGDVVSKVAQALRAELSLELVDPSLYGQMQQNVFAEKSVRFQNPLLLHAYLGDLMERREARVKPGNGNEGQSPVVLKADMWNHLNVLYAAMGVQEKTTASELFAKLIGTADRDWIASLRREPVWVQFRLLNLMKQVGGPEVVRELLWLSEQSQDEQLKALATSTLDAILGTGTLAKASGQFHGAQEGSTAVETLDRP